MAQSPDHSADGEKPASEAANNSHDGNLPMVVAPKLGAGEDEGMDEAPGAAAATPAAPAAPAPASPFLVLAAAVAFAAAFGSFVGSVSGSGLARYLDTAAPAAGAENTTNALREMNLELAELSAIKANLDTASRSTTSQFAKIADRLDRLDQRPTGATETTGSIANAANASLAAAEPPKLTDRILPDWVVQDVQNGRALVESRYGAVFDVGAGSVLPGVGRVDTIKRQGGQWVVLTARGTITSGR
jgi:hypothetical protein